MKMWFRLFLLVLACILLAPSTMAQQRANRVALIIGNANYPDASTPLSTTVKDARTLADEFKRLDFEVDTVENAGKEEMRRAIDAFTAKIRKDTEALFYFGGIGLQVQRRSYLLPVNAQIWSENDVSRDGISIDDVLADMHRKGARVTVIIVDAARRNPFERRFRASPMGLAPLAAPERTLALFSTVPGTVVNDRDGAEANSILVTELVKELRSPNQTAEQAFNRTRIGVARASNNEMVPSIASSLLEEFYFRGSGAAAPAPAAPAPVARAPTPAPAPAPVPAPAPAPPPVVAQPRPAPAPPPPAQAPAPAPSRQASTAPTRFETGQIFRDCADCPEMVVVPAGNFMMGAKGERERPVHRVQIDKPFAIGRYEITFSEWMKCNDEGPCNHRPSDRGWGRGNRPVINISWVHAKAYATWLSQKTGQTYRLPSEAEWEYAARAGTKTTFSWGADVGVRNANCADCNTREGPKTLPVGSFKPNAFGLFDTAGNVAEWVEDCWNDNYRNAPSDGSAWITGQCRLRVLRGGAFDSQSTIANSEVRFRYDYDVAYSANGFRLVRELP